MNKLTKNIKMFAFRFFIISVTLVLFSQKMLAQTELSVVFTSGNEGHKSYRIPAIIQLPDHELLAFAEGRVNGASDFGDVNIVMKRSKDQGKTWSQPVTIVDNENLQAGNPAPVVDLLDPNYPGGRIFLFYNTGNNHEDQVRKGNGIREVWYIMSSDGGNSWTEPVNITLQVHKPKQATINQAYNFAEDWRHYANTPGHALQLVQKPYAGRIYVASNHSTGNSEQPNEDYFAHGFYTDDHGLTFHLSEDVPLAGSNESTAAELSDGKLMLNARNQKGDTRARIVVISKNGGKSWDSVYFDHNLPDPVCEGSILNLGLKKGKQILAFCNNADTKNRNNLTLRISFDEGKTWSLSFPVDRDLGGQKPSFTAYSDIVKMNSKMIGVLYERDNYSQIVFKTIKWR